MGGGRGTRLYPLTKLRCKPAVPLAGKYRLVDIPISNCINSGYNKIYLLSQFNTASLHRHVQDAYRFDRFGGGFVEILSAEQTEYGDDWYQGTADAVRRNIMHFHAKPDDIFVILSGDQLYRMDFSKMVKEHLSRGAEVTVAAKPVPTDEASG
ncbi:MAG: sugar phosphate nucleotidyltransferase, partial [Verrucomicrobiia bacterium]